MVTPARLEPAHVLHRRPYRETSLLLEIFARGHGRLAVVARGARRARGGGAQAALLQPFLPLLLSWAGRGEMGTLTGVEPAAPAGRLGGRALLSAFYVNELLIRLLPREDPHPDLYQAYSRLLRDLAGPSAAEPLLRIFEKRLLTELGYALVLEQEAVTGAPVQPETLYCYRLEEGPVPCAPGTPGLLVHGATLAALAREELTDPRTLQEAKALMRGALAVHLGDRPLASRELFR